MDLHIDDLTTGRRPVRDSDLSSSATDANLRGIMVDDPATGRRPATSMADIVAYGHQDLQQSMMDSLTLGRIPLGDFVGILNISEFYAPLTHSLDLVRGSGSATFTRATNARMFGHSAVANPGDEQILLTVANNVPRFGGARHDSGAWYPNYADGLPIVDGELFGYLAEINRMNNLYYSRDLTQANWVKTNITAALNATGIDGAANSASTITATAPDATVLQQRTLTAAVRSSGVFIKRKTGTGAIYFTRNGGTSWTDVTSQINSSGFTRVKIENTSVTDPSVGIKIATSGDELYVDIGTDETGAYVTSPIITTGSATVTRNIDVLSYPTAGNILAAEGTILLTIRRTHNASGTIYLFGSYIDANNSLDILYTGTQFRLRKIIAGVNYSAVIASTFTADINYKLAAFWGPNGSNIAVNGTLGTPNSNTSEAQIAATMQIGTNGNNANSPTAYHRDVYIWQKALTATQLQALTL